MGWPRRGLHVFEHKAALSSHNELYQILFFDVFLDRFRSQVEEKAEHLLERAIRVVLQLAKILDGARIIFQVTRVCQIN
jgi:hypothetical protein